MESAPELDDNHVAAPPVTEADFTSVLPTAEPETYSVLMHSSEPLGGFVLADGSGTVLAPLPRSAGAALKPPVGLDALSALVDVAVGHPGPAADPDDPPEPADSGAQTGAAGPLPPPAGDHCLVCNSRQLDRQPVSVFEESVRSSTSLRPVLHALEAALETPLDPRVTHSHVLCSACFELTERLDRLREELTETCAAVRRLYWQTAGLYSEPQPPADPEPESAAEEARRRPLRPAAQHETGRYRSAAGGRRASPAPPPDPPPATEPESPAQCRDLDVNIHVHKAGSRKRTAAALNEDRLTCRYCCKKFQRPARLRQHLATHTPEGSNNRCHLCNKTFSQKYYLREHVKQVHERRSLHSCDQCGKAFMRRLHLDDHMRTHSGDRPYTCEVCGRGFSQRGNLRAHAMVHTDQFAFQCDTCGKRVRTRQALEAHQRKHNDERRFACTMCSETFLLKRSLDRHKRKHTGDRPFKCSQCTRAFRDRGDLRCHEDTHNASRAHVCPLCGQGFGRRYKMQAHLRSKHDRTDSQVQELCLLQQTAHTMLQQSQQKLEPITIMEMDEMAEADHQQHTAAAATEGGTESQTQHLLVLASNDPLPPG
ncbi:myeloid zinc finger 1-like [Amphibalanus amphitrite]|uniref:myeloid zinc finger 1-like n=1 Tax=Amphibalanus amphitrite TaxID=1232801 RepID=UPI001C91E4ED|nr:myeloid zinc finger 1-like [Amphibalanus amphitrite]